MHSYAITCGDINGIGPEICINTINKCTSEAYKIFLFIPLNVFEEIVKIIPPTFNYKIISETASFSVNESQVFIVDVGKAKISIGRPTKNSGNISLKAIELANEFYQSGICDAVITAPISKTAWDKASINYPGQTELFAHLDKKKNEPLMVFLSDQMICALATIHEPIKKVSKLITKKRISKTLEIFINSLQSDIGIENPKIAVLGLNPHAGEEGRIGKEEIESIIPAIEKYNHKQISGTYVSDAFFANQLYKNYDAVLGMYHDQVLIPFKMLNFDNGVNFTAGLEIIRVSPDHGTAYNIAWKGIANPSSMIYAFKWAEKILKNRSKNSE